MQEEKVEYFEYSPYLGGSLISHVLWLKNQKKTIKEAAIIQSINISSIILLCSYLESTLYYILSAIVRKNMKETETSLYLKLLNNCDDKIYKASWSQYIELSDLIFQKSLDKYTSNETWKGISILFNIRNFLVHGKLVKARYLMKQYRFETEFSGLLMKVINYLYENKVIRGKVYSSEKILSNQVINHFIKKVSLFIDELLPQISKEENIDLSYVIDFSKFNSMLSHGIDLETRPIKKTNKKLIP